MKWFYGVTAMNFFNLDLLYILALVVTSLHFILPASSVDEWLVASPPGLILDYKTRLGSTPPSCHNRCNGCNPCMAVQVPTFPVRGHSEPGLGNSVPSTVSSLPLIDKKYSNYKPLAWKCRCGNLLFNP